MIVILRQEIYAKSDSDECGEDNSDIAAATKRLHAVNLLGRRSCRAAGR